MDSHQQPARAISTAVRGLAAVALDWLYPPRCLACDDDIAETGALCSACWAETRFIDAPLCRRCGGPLAFEVEETSDLFEAAPSCPACRNRPMRWREARAAVVYGGAARR
ncbi:MAG: double zinc ribbon domain-containing protein, partial [Pseudomonadota bacterium]